jgi:phospholipid N-methyltransferase
MFHEKASGKWVVVHNDPANGMKVETKRFATEQEAQSFYDAIPQTHNYVIFDDSRIKITEENGKPVSSGTLFARKGERGDNTAFFDFGVNAQPGELLGQPKSTEETKPEPEPTPEPEPKAEEPPPSNTHRPTAVTNLDGFKEFAGRLIEGDITAERVKQAWSQFKAHETAIRADLEAMTKDQLMRYNGMRATKSDSKARLVDGALEGLESYFNPTGSLGFSIGSNYKESKRVAMEAAVEKWTDEQIQKDAQERRDAKAAKEKAITNPETKEEFERYVIFHGARGLSEDEKQEANRIKGHELRTWVQKRGESKLTPEQLEKYDALRGIDRKAELQREQERKAIVSQVSGIQNVGMTVSKHHHSKRGSDVWIVQMGERVGADKFKEMAEKARRLGGNWSREWKPTNSPAGFMFNTEKAASDFMDLKSGSVDRSDEVQANREEKKQNAAERLREMADRMDEKADESLNADRKTNTAKRASQAGYAESNARGQKAMATTLRNLADAIENREATHLDGIRNRAQVETLDYLATQAQRNAFKKEGLSYSDEEKRKGEPATPEQMANAEYPEFDLISDIAQSLARKLIETRGGKLLGERIWNRASSGRDRTVLTPDEAEQAMDKLGKNVAWQIENQMARYKHLQQMGITDLPSLRAALREFLEYRGRRASADPIKAAERELIGLKIPGFFPTPKSLVDRMVSEAGIEDGMKVLEPSAGKGDIADAAKDAGAQVDTVEISSTLRDLLDRKGHRVIAQDFTSLEPTPIYDRVLMNPPFENGQDITHVQKAYDFLKPGGRLVSVMSAGPFFRQDKNATAFRDWLEEHGAIAEPLPEGTFNSAEAFRQTGTNTYLVTVDKPETGKLSARRDENAFDFDATAGLPIFDRNNAPGLKAERQAEPAKEPAKSIKELVTENLGLAVSIANSFRNIRGIDLEDVVSEAKKALVKSAGSTTRTKARSPTSPERSSGTN